MKFGDNLRKIRDDFDAVKEPIENFLSNKSKNIFLEDTTLSLFNKYRKEFVGCSEDELTSKLFQIDKLNIKNIEEYNRKTMEMERFETFFPSEKYLTRFIVNNQITFDNTKEEQDYKINCHRVLRSLYDPYNEEESFEKIKKLSNSRFLIKSKNSLPALFSRFSTSENNKRIINTFIDKKVKSYISFEAFVQKYEVDKNSFDKLVTFIGDLPEDVYFADAVQKLDLLNEQIVNSNYPLTLNADNISNLTYEDLKECSSKDKTLNVKTLNKLLGLKNDVSPAIALPKTFYPDSYTDKSKIAKEVFQIRKDADNYPKLLNLFYPYDLPAEEMSYYDLKQYSYFIPNSFVNFVNSMSQTADGRNYNMSLHSKLRIIDRFALSGAQSLDELYTDEKIK